MDMIEFLYLVPFGWIFGLFSFFFAIINSAGLSILILNHCIYMANRFLLNKFLDVELLDQKSY